jgi:hypothetical protein
LLVAPAFTDRAGGGGGRRPVPKTNPFDKNRSKKDDATPAGNI